MVPCYFVPLAAGAGWTEHNVHPGPVVLKHVEIAGCKIDRLSIVQVTRDGQGLQKNFWHDHRTSEVQYHSAVLKRREGGNEHIGKRVDEIIKNFDVRPPNAELAAKALSGGNQQKLIIGREFELHPKLLLVSQPTRGVDIGAIEFIHRKLIELRDAGSAVLLVSAELEEVTALADRLLVIREGKIVGEVNPKVTSVEEIGLMMTAS